MSTYRDTREAHNMCPECEWQRLDDDAHTQIQSSPNLHTHRSKRGCTKPTQKKLKHEKWKYEKWSRAIGNENLNERPIHVAEKVGVTRQNAKRLRQINYLAIWHRQAHVIPISGPTVYLTPSVNNSWKPKYATVPKGVLFAFARTTDDRRVTALLRSV